MFIAAPNGRDCNCITAYLENAAGRSPCDAQNCERSSCAAIKNNFDASTRTFKSPPAIRRADGSDALRMREPKTYQGPYHVTNQDQEKLHQAVPPHQQSSGQEDDEESDQTTRGQRTRPRTQPTLPTDQQQQPSEGEGQQPQEHGHYHPGK